MTGLLAALAGAVGLLVGSFLNVVIWRVPRGESVVRPPSHCPGCGAAVRPRDNVPVLSFLALRGRCRGCRRRIGLRYPLVELGCGLLFAALALRLGPQAALPAYLYLAALSIALALIDVDVRRLPDALVLPAYPVAALLLGLAALADADAHAFLRALLGLSAYYGALYALAFAYPGGMGFGDVKLAGVLGLYLGYLGWGVLAVGAFAGVLLGALAGAGLLLAGRAGRRSAIPYGPFMLAGALLAVFGGARLAHGYLQLTAGS